MMFFWVLFLLLFGRGFADSDDDLMSFVTVCPPIRAERPWTDKIKLPEVRAVRFDVAYYDRESVSPGYWFVAPYGVIDPEAPTKQWKPCQIGPYIYDADGVCLSQSLEAWTQLTRLILVRP
jgi:hypothetical protein